MSEIYFLLNKYLNLLVYKDFVKNNYLWLFSNFNV